MPFPKTLDELRAGGYRFKEHDACKGPTCTAVLEFWETPAGKFMPLDVDDKGNVTPHWATCPDAEQFRTIIRGHDQKKKANAHSRG